MSKREINRRDFIKQSTIATAALATGLGTGAAYAAKGKGGAGRKVIIIGIDGMDPVLSQRLIRAGKLPSFAALAKSGGFRTLGTSIPPQTPVAWSNFINGAGPGSHGIFDFIHRRPEYQCLPFFSISDTDAGEGYLGVGDHKLQLDFWPFNHRPAKTLLKRQGVPFWDYLDKAGVSSTFYNLPCNYPPSPSKYGNHRCLAGMGTTDMLGGYGTYQHFAEDGPVRTRDEGGGKRSMLFFENERATAQLVGPTHTLLVEPKPVTVDFVVHRDRQAQAAVIEIQNHKVLLKKGQWSRWLKIDFELSMPWFLPNEHISGICRFYLQEVEPNFRLYVTPINTDPSDAYLQITEPAEFIGEMSDKLGLFYTTGFQEDHKALSNKIFTDAEYAAQAGYVLKERFNLLDYALKDYDDGLLFFYFSSTDLQSHMFWWDSDEKHPVRSPADARDYFAHLQGIYQRLDSVVGDILKRYGKEATVIVMSDHGFANFKRQFDLNCWLRENKYLGPANSTSVLRDVDWSQTRAYGLGINGLYINLRGRERDGIVEPGREKEELVSELVTKLEAVRDTNGNQVIRTANRSDTAYQGSETEFAPDIIVGYSRGYRSSWATGLGGMTDEVLFDNDSAWSADHCADASEVPGVVFANRPIVAQTPALIDIAPSVLTEFGLDVPASMQGKNIFST